ESGFFLDGSLAGTPDHWLQLHGCGPFYQLPVGVEARAVTGTVPGPSTVIPAQHTLHMGTDGAVGLQVSLWVTISRHVGTALADHAALVFRQVLNLSGRGL